VCNKPLLPLFGGFDPRLLNLVLEGIPIYPRSVTIKNDKLGKEFSKAMKGKKGCLMRGHGITTAGSSVEDATVTAILINEIAELNYRAHLLGGAKPISKQDIAEFGVRDKALKGRKTTKPSREDSNARVEASWKYYARLSGER
jgi:ribulose-5-phosphate 4-epimerase/fuculose-1-phosphate aldolase